MTPVVFFGSDRFSAVVLSTLVKQDHCPTLVVTDPPKPKGRKREITPNEVDLLAKNHNLKVLYYQSNNEELINYINTHHPIGLSASFPHLFPPSIINAFDGRLYNLHPSLLPQYRNVAPGPYAIAMGDTVTGISLFPISVGIDNGELVAQQQEKILPTDTTTSLLTRLFTMGTQAFLKFISDPNNPNLTANIPVMSSSELIFTRKLTRESGFIEWDIVQKLINDTPITKDETSNPLIILRLAHHPERTKNILSDLIRSLDTYEKVWTITKTGKGEIIISLSLDPNNQKSVLVLVSGKPKAIGLDQFKNYYLNHS